MNINKIKKTFDSNKPIILLEEKKEKEADFVFPGELVNDRLINFMLSYGKGLLCVTTDEDLLIGRGFFRLPSNKKDKLGTNYFITVDHENTDTGISAEERSKTITAIASGWPISKFKYPGHIQLIGSIGIQNRKGHTEGSVELMKLLSYKPYAVIIEILDEKGYSHNFEYIQGIANKYDIPLINMRELYIEILKKRTFILPISEAYLPTKFGNFKIIGFKNLLDHKEHFAIYKGDLKKQPLMLRIHSECVTGDALTSLKCDCGSQLHLAMKKISEYGSGIILYLRQEGRGIGITNKIRAYELQDKGFDTVNANTSIGFPPDNRDYDVAYQMLKSLGINEVILLTNNPNKVTQLKEYGIDIVNVENLWGQVTPENRFYLETKVLKMGHKIDLNNLNMGG